MLSHGYETLLSREARVHYNSTSASSCIVTTRRILSALLSVGQERLTTQHEGLHMFRGASRGWPSRLSLPRPKFLDVRKDLGQTVLTQQMSPFQSAQGLPGALDWAP